MRNKIKSATIFILLFPTFVFACGKSNKPELHIEEVSQVLDENSIRIVIPRIFNGKIFDSSSVNLGDDKVFIAVIPLKTKEVVKRRENQKKGHSVFFYAHFSINRMMENKFKLVLNYRESPRENGGIRACLTRFEYSFVELLEAHNLALKKDAN